MKKLSILLAVFVCCVAHAQSNTNPHGIVVPKNLNEPMRTVAGVSNDNVDMGIYPKLDTDHPKQFGKDYLVYQEPLDHQTFCVFVVERANRRIAKMSCVR